MKYFNNPTTEEELKNQYRKLLIKHDYRSEKNAGIIAEIKKEHDMIQIQIKRSNGYRTTSEKVIDGAKELHREYSNARREEEERISRLKNHKYTKVEIQSLVDETKKYITKIIYIILKKQSYDYVNLKDVVKKCDTEQIARWVNTHARKMVDSKLSDEYDEIREKLEYALKSQSKDKKSQEAFMIQMEKMMGNHIISVFNKYEKEIVDPIIVAEQNMRSYETKKSDKKEMKFRKILYWIAWIVSAVYATFDFLTNRYTDLTDYIFSLIFITILYLVLHWFTVILPKKIADKLDKKTLAGIGARKHNSRVSEKKQYQQGRTQNALVRLIVKLFIG